MRFTRRCEWSSRPGGPLSSAFSLADSPHAALRPSIIHLFTVAGEMKFGILYNIDYRPEVHGSSASYYGQILEQIEIIEELGFDSVWFGEHHYAGYSFGAPAVIATAAAGRTRRLRLGTGVSLIPLHNPLCLAEEYAMLDVLSN